MAGLYIHIPFCRRRCNYCDFYFVTNSALIADFLAALTKELSGTRLAFRRACYRDALLWRRHTHLCFRQKS
jgi:coproporphyrinogen III oxidase-like Fe-S oxidoreductase